MITKHNVEKFTKRFETDPDTGEIRPLNPDSPHDLHTATMAKLFRPFVRDPYNYDMNAASNETGIACPEPTLTQQNGAEDTDINVIVAKFGLTGQLPTDLKTPLNIDFVETIDFKTAMDQIQAAREAFMEMPANIRARFGNDPGQFVDFASDPENRDEARKLGLLVPEKAPIQPMEVRIVDPAPGGDKTGQKP